MIDVGSNVGVSVLYFRSIHPRCRVICFEADPAIFQLLKENLQANGCGDVSCIQAAAWTHDRGVRFTGDGADAGAVVDASDAPLVPSKRLRDVLESHAEIDLLKVDIEGAETTVLLDCGEALRRVKYLYVEYHGFPDRPRELHALLALLHAQGFRYHLDRIGSRHKQPFVALEPGVMDMQLDIHAIRQ